MRAPSLAKTYNDNLFAVQITNCNFLLFYTPQFDIANQTSTSFNSSKVYIWKTPDPCFAPRVALSHGRTFATPSRTAMSLLLLFLYFIVSLVLASVFKASLLEIASNPSTFQKDSQVLAAKFKYGYANTYVSTLQLAFRWNMDCNSPYTFSEFDSYMQNIEFAAPQMKAAVSYGALKRLLDHQTIEDFKIFDLLASAEGLFFAGVQDSRMPIALLVKKHALVNFEVIKVVQDKIKDCTCKSFSVCSNISYALLFKYMTSNSEGDFDLFSYWVDNNHQHAVNDFFCNALLTARQTGTLPCPALPKEIQTNIVVDRNRLDKVFEFLHTLYSSRFPQTDTLQ